jgi:hypothetical protein
MICKNRNRAEANSEPFMFIKMAYNIGQSTMLINLKNEQSNIGKTSEICFLHCQYKFDWPIFKP